MHEHNYSAGAIRGNLTVRYCDCGDTLIYNGLVKRSGKNDDVDFYKLMAERYRI